MTIDQSLEAFRLVVEEFRAARPDGFVRGYVSTAFECPYEGRIDPGKAVVVCERLMEIGVDELSIGDTIGVAVPSEVASLDRLLIGLFPIDKMAYHFHDTRGTAIANVAQALEDGIRAFDSSAAGLGGCPYAQGAGGNLATEDLVYFLERMGMVTGINAVDLAEASSEILELLGRSPASKTQQATLAACRHRA